MSRLRAIGALGAAMLLAAGFAAPQAPQLPLGSAADVETFAKALESCTTAAVNTPHPLMKAFVVEHKVTGTEKDRCAYRQTMPGRMNMVCALSSDGRMNLATDLRAMANAQSIKGSTSGTGPTWMKECEIEMPDGKRIPATGK